MNASQRSWNGCVQIVSDRAWIKDAGSHKRPLLGLVFETALSPMRHG